MRFWDIICMLFWAALVQAQIKVACIGDSVTDGLGISNQDSSSYPAQLQHLLGKQYVVGNFGHSGATLLRKGHNPYAKTEKLKQAIAFKADIAIIHLGLNDTDPRNFPHFRDEFKADYLWLLDTLRTSNPSIQIFVCQMTPIFTGHPRFTSSTFKWYHALQNEIREVVEIANVPKIDLYEALHNRPDLITDLPTLHPNERGAKRIAEVVYNHMSGNFGGLTLGPLFQSHMIVQRNQPFVIWGKANATTTVEVSWASNTRNTQAGVDGYWRVEFPALPASHISQEIVIKNQGTTKVLTDVLVGDVWFAGGQSNMEFQLSNADQGDSLATVSENRSSIRLFQLKGIARTDNVTWSQEILDKANQLEFFKGTWEVNSKEAARRFSAVAYSFAHEINKSEEIPIGVIELSVGGSPQLSWLPRLSLESNPTFVGALHPWRKSDFLMTWCRERATKNVGQDASTFQQHPYAPSYMFEAGVKPLLPFGIKGTIWYQGESDAENAELYEQLFPYFISEWRKEWNAPQMPFYYVQLSSINRASWPHFRDLQRRLYQSIDLAGMVVSSDVGDVHDVHPKAKIVIGQRLGRWALHQKYAREMLPSGPLYKAHNLLDNALTLTFDYASGLRAVSDSVKGFKIEDRAGHLLPIKAQIVGEKVLIILPENTQRVVYGWSPYSDGNLINGEGLPASTFQLFIKPNYK